MKKTDYLSTLFVGIDIGSRTNVVSAIDFNQEFLIRMKPVPNAKEGAETLESLLVDVLSAHHEFNHVIIGLEVHRILRRTYCQLSFSQRFVGTIWDRGILSQSERSCQVQRIIQCSRQE
jgi:predicted transposase